MIVLNLQREHLNTHQEHTWLSKSHMLNDYLINLIIMKITYPNMHFLKIIQNEHDKMLVANCSIVLCLCELALLMQMEWKILSLIELQLNILEKINVKINPHHFKYIFIIKKWTNYRQMNIFCWYKKKKFRIFLSTIIALYVFSIR